MTKKIILDEVPSNYYVKPLELKEEILKSINDDELTKKALHMLMLMVKNMSRKFSYKYEEDRKDCQAFALLDIARYWRGFDPEKSNYPFSYYSQMIKNGLAKGIKKVRPKSETDVIRISGDEMFNF